MLHVVHMARANVVVIRGGPLLTIHLMLKVKEVVDPPGVEMSAVFGDRVVRSYKSEISPIMERYNQRSEDPLLQRIARRVFPRIVRFCAELGLSSLRFGYHFERGTRGNKERALVLHSHDPLSGYLCHLRHRGKHPHIHTIHGKAGSVKEPLLQYPVFQGTPVEKMWRHIEATIAKRVDVMVFTSKGSRQLYESEYPGLLQDTDVRIVYPGVDTDDLDLATYNRSLLSEYGVAEGNSVVLCVSKLVTEKGIDTLIEAIALVPEDIRSKLSCLIVGGGHLENEVQSLISERGMQDNVKLLGFLPRKELLDLTKSSTVFALPSRVAVFDYALLEAAAMRLPIITTRVGGNLEMFPDNSALLVPPDEPQALSEAISEVLTNGELRTGLAQRAYDRVRGAFSLESMLKNYLIIYEEMARQYQDRQGQPMNR